MVLHKRIKDDFVASNYVHSLEQKGKEATKPSLDSKYIYKKRHGFIEVYRGTMLFTLTNEQRVYLGLELIEENWECVSLWYGEILYFDSDIIRKSIVIRENYYCESSLYEITTNDRMNLLPKTNGGKAVKLTKANLEKRTRTRLT